MMKNIDWGNLGMMISTVIVGLLSGYASLNKGKNKDRRDNFQMLYDNQQKQISSLQRKFDRLQKEFDKVISENNKVKQLNTQLQETNRELINENGQLKQENKLLNTNLNDYKNIYGRLKGANK